MVKCEAIDKFGMYHKNVTSILFINGIWYQFGWLTSFLEGASEIYHNDNNNYCLIDSDGCVNIYLKSFFDPQKKDTLTYEMRTIMVCNDKMICNYTNMMSYATYIESEQYVKIGNPIEGVDF